MGRRGLQRTGGSQHDSFGSTSVGRLSRIILDRSRCDLLPGTVSSSSTFRTTRRLVVVTAFAFASFEIGILETCVSLGRLLRAPTAVNLLVGER